MHGHRSVRTGRARSGKAGLAVSIAAACIGALAPATSAAGVLAGAASLLAPAAARSLASAQLPALPARPPQSAPAGPASDTGAAQAGLPLHTCYVAPDGDDANPGTSIDAPWKTLKHSIAQLRPGDTLFVRGGTYLENRVSVDVSGAPGAPITICAYPDEHPVIDGSYPQFRTAGNQAWELFDASLQIFRSVDSFPNAGTVYGHYGEHDGSWALVPYELHGPFGTVNESYSDAPPFYYIGPGLYWDSGDARIYYRSKQSIYQLADGLDVPHDPDPRNSALYIFPKHEVLELGDDVGYVVLAGLDIRNQQTALSLRSGAHHITVRDCNILGGRYHVLVRGGCHDLTFDGVTVAGKVPEWITWTDVKRPEFARPGHLFQGSAIQLEDNVDRVEIMHGSFTGVFDAIGANDEPSNLHVHHNVFDVRDDVLSLGSAGWNVEFDHNRVLRAHAGGPSWSGSGSPPAAMAGTVYIHHNVIDTSVPQRFGRWDPLGLLDHDFQGPAGDGFATGRTFGMHSMDAITGPAPWKIYNNTAIIADDVYNGGAGQAYRIPYFDREIPHEVYDNIFVQLSDEWVLRDARADDGSQIFDGNLYWAPNRQPGTHLLEDLWTGALKQDFGSLAQFLGSGACAATKSYYAPGWEASGIEADPRLDASFVPDPSGPAASGAVDLSDKHWPGATGEGYRGALAPAGSK